MYRSVIRALAISLVLTITLSSVAICQDVVYKEYRRASKKADYFEISFNRTELEITVLEEGGVERERFSLREIETRDAKATVGSRTLFDSDALFFKGRALALKEIYDTRVETTDDHTLIAFFKPSGESAATNRVKRGNLIRPQRRVVVDEEDFIRGLIVNVTGGIEILGEVNKDVISLFGDIYVGPEAVVRGDIVSITGQIDIARGAAIYGEVYTGSQKRRRRYQRWQERNQLELTCGGVYNRVDGAFLHIGMKFVDSDSLLPSIWASTGYAFASERWRYKVGLEQSILRRPALAIGGEYYRRLASEDDWVLSEKENTVFALLVTEDFKDYYEAEGGTVYFRLRPFQTLTVEGRFRREETKWLDAHSHLFSLFGGDKSFRENFSTVDTSSRAIGIAELDSTTNASLSASIDWNTRDDEEPFRKSAWTAGATAEWSTPDLDSDFDYRRYRVAASRYQRVNRRAMLIMRAMYGGSDGYMPMYKQFFLGGLGTLHGYKQKELGGSRFWMTNAEYRVDFPRTDLALSVLWDAAQITENAKLDESVEVKHSLGVALYVGSDFRVSLAKRLDRSDHDNPRFYVRLVSGF